MLSADRRPVPPAIPSFSRDMEQALVAVARASSPARPTRSVRRAKWAAACIAAAAVAAAAGVGIDHAVGSGPPAASHPPAGHAVHIHVAAFLVDTGPGGTVTVTLLRDYAPDPSALRQALAGAGVPALVTVGSVCSAPVPSSALNQVLTSRRHLADGTTILTIVPRAIPAGWELNIGYFQVPGGNGIHVSLVPEGAPLTCRSAPPFVTG
jgi:hypothetical protein